MAASYFLLVCILSVTVSSALRSRFLPFGTAEGDTLGTPCDDCTHATVSFPFSAADANEDDFAISNNGFIYTPVGYLYITPASIDLDNRQADGGSVFYGPRTNAALLASLSGMISSTFQAVQAYVITWDNMGRFYMDNNVRNTIQLVMVVDANRDTWAFFYYGDMSRDAYIGVLSRANGDAITVSPADIRDLLVHVSANPPTLTPVLVSQCGNGEVNGAEQCDGGECCNADCTFKMDAYCFCERQTFVGGEWAQNFFCESGQANKYYQCLQGPWSPTSRIMDCPAGTACGCGNGAECSCGGMSSPCVAEGTQQTC